MLALDPFEFRVAPVKITMHALIEYNRASIGDARFSPNRVRLRLFLKELLLLLGGMIGGLTINVRAYGNKSRISICKSTII